MKQTYKNPTTTIVNIELTRLMAGSPEGFDNNLGGEGSDGSKGLSRRGFWDDDEE